MNYCLPKHLAAKFLEELKAGRIDPDKLAEMTSAERRAFFEPIVGKENARQVNAQYESTLLLKDQQAGLIRWAKSVGGITEPVRRGMLAKIAKMDKILTPDDEHGFLADLAEQKLGTAVTEDEARRIGELSRVAIEARDAPTDRMSGANPDFLKASDALRHYVESLKPQTAQGSIGKNLLVIGRNHMLANPSTPIKAVENQAFSSALEAVSRRISTMTLLGASRDVAAQGNKQAWDDFRATGRNTAAMESIYDAGTLGEGHNFDLPDGMLSSNPTVHAIEAGVRKYAAFTNKVVIDKAHNVAFTKFYQKTFFDSLNIGATNIARSEGAQAWQAQRAVVNKADLAAWDKANPEPAALTTAAIKGRSDELVRDAARIEPATDAGTLLRQQAQMQAARVTSSNETWLSSLAMGMKAVLNGEGQVKGKRIPGVKGLGDILIPMAKIPANVIWNGIQNAGPGIPLGGWDILQSRAKLQSEDEQIRREGAAQFANGARLLARTFGALAVGALLTSYLKKNDFMTDHYGHTFVKVFGTWISTEYVGAVSPAMAGMMYIRKYGRDSDSFAQTAGHYVSGAAQGLAGAPGVDELNTLVTSVRKSDAIAGLENYGYGALKQRAVPAFAPNLFMDRWVNRLAFGAHGVETPADVAHDKAVTAAHRRETRIENLH